jgi:hypothetical protein
MFDQLLNNLTMAKEVEDVEDSYLGILVMGGPGSGKTNLASTAPKPQLVLDFDHGLTTYASNGLVKGRDYYPYTFDKFITEDAKGGKDRKVMRSVENITAIIQLLAYAADRSGAFAPGGIDVEDANGQKYNLDLSDTKTIVLDGFTSMSEYFLYEIMTSRLGLNYDKDKPGFEGYGQLLRALGNVCELLIKCKKHYHVVGTALIKWEQRPGSNSEGDVIANPNLDGAFRNQIGKVLDEFYFLDSRRVGSDNKYYLYSQPLPTVPNLKSRSQLPAKLEAPTFTKIFSAFVEAHNKHKRG